MGTGTGTKTETSRNHKQSDGKGKSVDELASADVSSDVPESLGGVIFASADLDAEVKGKIYDLNKESLKDPELLLLPSSLTDASTPSTGVGSEAPVFSTVASMDSTAATGPQWSAVLYIVAASTAVDTVAEIVTAAMQTILAVRVARL